MSVRDAAIWTRRHRSEADLAPFLLSIGASAGPSGVDAPSPSKYQSQSPMDALTRGANALFLLLGAIMVLSMHAGFAFLELGTVRKKNQVNALVKILVDFSVSTIVYFLVGFGVAYGTHFFVGAE